VQETTFNSPYQANGDVIYSSVHLWLDALYANSKDTLQNKESLRALKNFESIKKLQSAIQYPFENHDLLITAFTHSTFCYEFEVVSNERLEFLGDSLVNFIVAKILYKKFPDSNEGELSKLRGALVNEHSLALLANSISLGENLLLGKGEYKNGGHLKESLLADAFEAMCAAVYLDCSEKMDKLESTLMTIINNYELSSGSDFFALQKLEQFDSKTQLQEIVVALFQVFPTYKSHEEMNGFTVELWIGERKIAQASGASKKKLEKELARLVLDEKRYQL
jgi:ribonuclease-3